MAPFFAFLRGIHQLPLVMIWSHPIKCLPPRRWDAAPKDDWLEPGGRVRSRPPSSAICAPDKHPATIPRKPREGLLAPMVNFERKRAMSRQR